MYGIYSHNTERFIAIHNDLWITMATAKLLSSKLTICVCIFNDPRMTNENCLQWSLVDPGIAIGKQDSQYPRLTRPVEILFAGDPIDVNLEVLRRHQKFCITALKVIRAAWMTDAGMNTGDRKYLQSLVGSTYFDTDYDDSGIQGGLRFNVEKIIYLNKSEDEVMQSIDEMFNNPNSIFPTRLKLYKKVFYDFLQN